MSVFVTLSSTTLIELAVTLEMMGGCCTGGGDAFFLEPAKAGVETIPSRAAITKRMELDLFTALLLREWNIVEQAKKSSRFPAETGLKLLAEAGIGINEKNGLLALVESP